MNRKSVWLLAALTAGSLAAEEYFVSASGSDGNAGTETSPFKTIQKGVEALKAGDVLTILPGKYHGSVYWKFDGSAEKRTIVRAKIPGSVLVHGDLPAKGFQPVPGRRNSYAVDWPELPQTVMECDTQVNYTRRDAVGAGSPLVSFAAWHYDEAAKKLHISTSDGLPPEKHRITVSDSPKHGIHVAPATRNGKVINVEVDGLCFRGFNTNTPVGNASIWGIMIDNPENCTIRRCHAYLNAGGIGMYEADRCRIEECTGVSNGTTNHPSAGNIIMLSSRNSEMDRCLSINSRTGGIRFYGSLKPNDRISRSVSLGDIRGTIRVKPCDNVSMISEVYAPDAVACIHSEYSVFSYNEYDPTGKNGTTSQVMKKVHVTECGRDFADPWNCDLRLQEGSEIKRGFKGKNVYFIAPNGKDENSGRSIDAPWKTLKNVPADSTVYFLPGTYEGGLELTAGNVTLAGRGQHAPAVIQGGKNGLTVTGGNVTLLRLSFVGSRESGVVCRGRDMTIDRCGFAALNTAVRAESAPNLRVTHSAFDSSLKHLIAGENPTGVILHSILPNGRLPAGVILAGNSYADAKPATDPAAEQLTPKFTNAAKGDFSLKNEYDFHCRALDGFAIGPYFVQYAPDSVNAVEPELIQAGNGAASIGWWYPGMTTRTILHFREKGKNWRAYYDYTTDNDFHTVTVPGLTPGTGYEYRLQLQPRMGYQIVNRYLPPLPKGKNPKRRPKPKVIAVGTPVKSFTQPEDRPARSWHVSAKNGSDLNDGSAEKPFLSIFRAAAATLPGDEVVVHGGVYRESVTIPCGGLPDKPIVYRAAPNEMVWMDGYRRRFCRGFVMFGKNHLKFDGFHFRLYGTKYPNTSGCVMVGNGKGVEVTRCFHDGRGRGYSPPLLTCRVGEDITLRNSVAISGMSQVTLVNVKSAVMENNVFVLPSIYAAAVHGSPEKSIRFNHNIVTDSIRAKTFQSLLYLSRLNCLEENDNAYYTRFPRDLRWIVGYSARWKEKNWSWTPLTLDEYYRKTGKDGGSFFTNPKFPILNLWQWKDAAERERDQAGGNPFGIKVNNQEYSRHPEDMSKFLYRDFQDCFPRPKLTGKDGKVIGLDPEQFKDMSIDKPQKTWEQR